MLSANHAGLQSLVNICQEFASTRNLKFGTNSDPSKSKTKCIVFSKRQKDCVNLSPIRLNNQELPWVKKIMHLGCTLEADNSMRTDMTIKRGRFIGKVNSLLQEFHFSDPSTLAELTKVYASSFYGSTLWNLNSKEAERLYAAWNVAMRNIFQLDRKTHRYLVQPLSDCLHLKATLLGRLVQFYQGLLKSNKFTIRFLVRIQEHDMRTVLGQTLDFLVRECGLKLGETRKLTASLVKKKLLYAEVPHDMEWKVNLARELIDIRDGRMEVFGFERTEIDNLLTYCCTT